MYIKIPPVDTIWSGLGKCELSASVVEKANCYEAIGVLNPSVQVLFYVSWFLHIVLQYQAGCSMGAAILIELCTWDSPPYPTHIKSCSVWLSLQAFLGVGAMGLTGGLEADRCIFLGVSLIQMKLNAWSSGATRGVNWGLQITTFLRHLFLDSVLVPVLWGTSGCAQQTPAIHTAFFLQTRQWSPGLMHGFPLQGCVC